MNNLLTNRPFHTDKHYNDAELWQQLKQGNRHALELIFHRYYADLYRYGVKLTGHATLVEDQIQNLFLKIWERRDSLGDVKGIKTYLWTALRRDLLAEKKKHAVRLLTLAGERDDSHRMYFSAEELIINDEQKAELLSALKEAFELLSDKQREILYLKFFDGMTYEEIEGIMSISYQTARNYVYEGLKSLQTIMKDRQSYPAFYTGSVLPLIALLPIVGLMY